MLEEIQQKAKKDENQIRRIIEFLKEYKFVAVNETKKKVRLDKMVQKFLTQTATS